MKKKEKEKNDIGQRNLWTRKMQIQVFIKIIS